MNNFPKLAAGVQAWGLAHWTYIATATVAFAIGWYLAKHL